MALMIHLVVRRVRQSKNDIPWFRLPEPV